MTSITESGTKLIPIIDMALTVLNKENQLAPLQHVIHNLQMAMFWLKTANKDLTVYTQGTIDTETEKESNASLPIPTLFSTQDQLEFIKTSLETITKELNELNDSLASVPSVQYKIQRGFDKIHEGLFNNELAINYYQQITNARTRK